MPLDLAMAMDSLPRSSSRRRPPGRTGSGAPASQVLRAARSCGLATRFHAWTGLSGRRYVVSVHSRREGPDFSDAVLLAVKVEEAGGLTLLGARSSEDGMADWDALEGADEVHVHLLARTVGARRDVVLDLTGEAPERQEPR